MTRMEEYRDPNSWYDTDGRQWCHECKGEVFLFKDGWACDHDGAAYEHMDPQREER